MKNIIINYRQGIYNGGINNNKTIGNIRRQQGKQIHNHCQQTQVMPGNTSCVDMVKKGKDFTVLGDSITGGIKQNEMTKH